MKLLGVSCSVLGVFTYLIAQASPTLAAANPQAAAASTSQAVSAPPSPNLNPSPWPTYLASDFDKSNHPQLSDTEKAQIQLALSRVKPCQRARLRYAFPSNSSFGLPLVLFFEPKLPTEAAHVFWTNGTYYKADGEVFASPEGVPRVSTDIAYDIDHTPCD